MRYGRQPISRIYWLHRTQFGAVSHPEIGAGDIERSLDALLAHGWTRPIVMRLTPRADAMEIVEGWEMWEAAKDLRVYDLTDGLLPVVFVWQTGQSEHAPA